MRRVRQLAWPALFLAAGLIIGHYPMLFSRFRLMEAELGDTRFINYILEHSWRWLIRAPNHLSLWDPPFLFPTKNVLAYSETMLGSAPLYYGARLFGLDMSTAYQVWLLSLAVLNFSTFYWLARRVLRAAPVAASAGSALFAFAGVRLAQAGHYQLYPQFWSVVALLCLAAAQLSQKKHLRRLGAFLFPPTIAFQLWAGFYLGWFLLLALTTAACAALAIRASRNFLFQIARDNFAVLLAGTALAAICLFPMLRHYRAASLSVGSRSIDEVMAMVPDVRSWIHLGRPSFLYGKLAEHPLFSNLPMENEQRLGFGCLTTILAIAGWWLGRRRVEVLISAICAIGLFTLSLRIGDLTIWRWVFAVVPGGSAIRAVTRVALVVLLPVTIGVMVAIERLAAKAPGLVGRAVLSATLGVFCLIEQAQQLRGFDKEENRAVIRRLASNISKERCDTFFYTPVGPRLPRWKYQIDAMWAELETGVPTINGYSGNHPPGWQLEYSVINSNFDQIRLAVALDQWRATQLSDASKICWLRLQLPEQMKVN